MYGFLRRRSCPRSSMDQSVCWQWSICCRSCLLVSSAMQGNGVILHPKQLVDALARMMEQTCQLRAKHKVYSILFIHRWRLIVLRPQMDIRSDGGIIIAQPVDSQAVRSLQVRMSLDGEEHSHPQIASTPSHHHPGTIPYPWTHDPADETSP